MLFYRTAYIYSPIAEVTGEQMVWRDESTLAALVAM